MPLHTRIEVNSNTQLYVWKITESTDYLRDIKLSKNSLNRINSMKSASHQRGFLSIRHLLKICNLKDDDLFYNENGKPLLKDKRHISISHSFDFSAIVISNQPVGIDIEKNREKIITIKNRFCNEEQNNTDLKSFIQKLTFIWAAKESMFKIHPSGGMNFKNDLQLQSFNNQYQYCKGKINTPELEQKCNIQFHQMENYGLAVATT